MIEIRLATLVVIWFPKYLLTNKSILDLNILHALGIATNMKMFCVLIYLFWFQLHLMGRNLPLKYRAAYFSRPPQKVSIENVKISINKKLWSLKFYYLTFYYFLLPTTFLLRIDIFISIASRILLTGQTCVLSVLLVHF